MKNYDELFYVYILTNDFNTVLYTGVTNDLVRRMNEHFEGRSGFTGKYRVRKLVYYETFSEINETIYREKQIKAGSRQKKLDLIQSTNPEWTDLMKD
jgi:putative endonuclease